jgi:hypothetical protein
VQNITDVSEESTSSKIQRIHGVRKLVVFEILTSVTVTNTIFKNVTPESLVKFTDVSNDRTLSEPSETKRKPNKQTC